MTVRGRCQGILTYRLNWVGARDGCVSHCGPKGPYFRDWVLIGTFFTFGVTIKKMHGIFAKKLSLSLSGPRQASSSHNQSSLVLVSDCETSAATL